MAHIGADTSFEESIREDVPLAPLTTLGIGGPAKFFAEVTNSQNLIDGIAWARSRSMPVFVLGGGSNVVISDRGFTGLVLHVKLCGVETRVEGPGAIITAGAGENWDSLVAMSVARGWAGFECLSGIPGSVGATPIQNVGAYGQEVSETFVSLEAVDTEQGEVVSLGAGECEFGYRTSRFKTRDRDRFIITSVTYRLMRDGRPAIRYPEIERYVEEHVTGEPSLADVRESVLAIRRRKAMVIDPNDPDSRSVGSFFVNPVVTREELEQIRERVERRGGRSDMMPQFPAGEDRVKLSAAWLIERAGFERGYRHGNVGISTRHALAIVNRGGGTASEVMELAEEMKSRMLNAFAIELITEPVAVGFDELPDCIISG
ncbi:MAG TPA: UDP-N-acetylmuramate dehydrogenase [Blastocatellia bacterium]|nr:UDP-N-acetylmuramate dehydrogenase [Blastocatellia bacterium]